MSTTPSSFEKDLTEFMTTVPYGEANVNFKTHKSKVTVMDVNVYETVRYDNNEKALAQLLQLFKQYGESNFSGNMTFTFTFKDGKIDRVIRQGFRRFNY